MTTTTNNNNRKIDQAVLTINPYYDIDIGIWCFDDPRFNLVKEGLVDGIDILIEKATREFGIPSPEAGFFADFSDEPFDRHEIELRKKFPRDDLGGYYYYSPQFKQLGWLCPALFHYFKEAPEVIYVRLRASS